MAPVRHRHNVRSDGVCQATDFILAIADDEGYTLGSMALIAGILKINITSPLIRRDVIERLRYNYDNRSILFVKSI